ncbi:MAG: hypothetical protein F4W90_05440 [Gammaproteobacteria bacterium]|nr:hypothetical protein [Gammaproteobacteria bacterium]
MAREIPPGDNLALLRLLGFLMPGEKDTRSKRRQMRDGIRYFRWELGLTDTHYPKGETELFNLYHELLGKCPRPTGPQLLELSDAMEDINAYGWYNPFTKKHCELFIAEIRRWSVDPEIMEEIELMQMAEEELAEDELYPYEDDRPRADPLNDRNMAHGLAFWRNLQGN